MVGSSSNKKAQEKRPWGIFPHIGMPVPLVGLDVMGDDDLSKGGRVELKGDEGTDAEKRAVKSATQ